ncbi:hypothetical protein D9M72_300930 [compost metagenome]
MRSIQSMQHGRKAPASHGQVRIEHHHGGAFSGLAHGGVDPAGISQVSAGGKRDHIRMLAAHKTQRAVSGGVVRHHHAQGEVARFGPQALQKGTNSLNAVIGDHNHDGVRRAFWTGEPSGSPRGGNGRG